MIDYYEKLDYKYPEKCIAKEKFNILKPGLVKFYIPALMPFIKEDKPKLMEVRPSNTHLLNSALDEFEPTEECKTANFVEIELPKWIVSVIKDYRQVIKKEDIFMAKLNDSKANTGGMFPNLEFDFCSDIQLNPDDIYYDKNEDLEIKDLLTVPSEIVDTAITYKHGKKVYINEKDDEMGGPIAGENVHIDIIKMNIGNMVPIIPLINKFDDKYRFNMKFDDLVLPDPPPVEEPPVEEPPIEPEIYPETGWPIDPETGLPIEPSPEEPEDNTIVYNQDNLRTLSGIIPPIIDPNAPIKGNGGMFNGDSRPYSIPVISLLDVLEREYFYDIDVYNMVSENKEFIVTFIGGDIKNKKIIGRYN